MFRSGVHTDRLDYIRRVSYYYTILYYHTIILSLSYTIVILSYPIVYSSLHPPSSNHPRIAPALDDYVKNSHRSTTEEEMGTVITSVQVVVYGCYYSVASTCLFSNLTLNSLVLTLFVPCPLLPRIGNVIRLSNSLFPFLSQI